MVISHDWVSYFHARNEIERVFLPLKENMLFVSINFSPEKVFVRFPAFVNSTFCSIRA